MRTAQKRQAWTIVSTGPRWITYCGVCRRTFISNTKNDNSMHDKEKHGNQESSKEHGNG